MKINHFRPVESTQKISGLVTAYRKSGLSLRRFAQENGIPPSRLHYWVYHKCQTSKPRSSAKASKTLAAPMFREMTLGSGSALLESWAAEVRLASGVNVRFSGAALPGWIGAVVEALQRPC